MEEKNCDNCGVEKKSIFSSDCNGCDAATYPKWKPSQNHDYPEPDETTWPPNAKLSKGTLNIDKLIEALNKMGEGLYPNDSDKRVPTLGKITSDGERGYICTHCGKTVTRAHHIKPETYMVIYKGQTFYMEKHICNDCMNACRKVKGGHYILYDPNKCSNPNCICHTGKEKDWVRTPFPLDMGNPYCCSQCSVVGRQTQR
jgi:hypothetical protein